MGDKILDAQWFVIVGFTIYFASHSAVLAVVSTVALLGASRFVPIPEWLKDFVCIVGGVYDVWCIFSYLVAHGVPGWFILCGTGFMALVTLPLFLWELVHTRHHHHGHQ